MQLIHKLEAWRNNVGKGFLAGYEPPLTALQLAPAFLTIPYMIVGKITAKSQTTIPKAVRNALGVKPGDEVGWEIDGDSATIFKIQSTEADPFIGNFTTFTEWADEIDAAFDVL